MRARMLLVLNALLTGMAAALALGAAGCSSAPADPVVTAIDALRNDNFRKFRSTLSGRALEKFGEPEKFSELRSRLGRYEAFEALPITQDDGPLLVRHGQAHRIFEAEVLGHRGLGNIERVLRFSIECESHWPNETPVPAHSWPSEAPTETYADCTIVDIND